MSETVTDTAARHAPARRSPADAIFAQGDCRARVMGTGIGAALIYGLLRPDRTAAPEELDHHGPPPQPADGLRDAEGAMTDPALVRPCRAIGGASSRSNDGSPSG